MDNEMNLSNRIPAMFGSMVFGEEAMKKRIKPEGHLGYSGDCIVNDRLAFAVAPAPIR